MKKIIALVLSLTLMLCTFSLFATTASAEEENGFYYSVSAGKATITGVTVSILNPLTGPVTIPESLGGVPVCAIGANAFSLRTQITSVTFPESVTSIGSNAFMGCVNLASAQLPSKLATLSNNAFSGCTALTSIEIPGTLKTVGISAFSGCTKLASVKIASGVTALESAAFSGCAALRSIVLPRSVTIIGNNCFNTSGLASINLNYIKTIGSSAFTNTELTSVKIPKAIATVPIGAFYGCSKLSSVTIPKGITAIGHSAFYGCKALTKISIPSSVTLIDFDAFYGCTGLTAVTIPKTVTSIGDDAFGKYYDSTASETKTIAAFTITAPAGSAGATYALDTENNPGIIYKQGDVSFFQRIIEFFMSLFA